MPSFVKAFLDYSKEFESPTSFWKWSAYASIAAILRDAVYMPQGAKRLYPNLYILFLAPSGYRKGPPVEDSEKLIRLVANTKIISGRGSIQGILDELSRTETDRKTGKMIQGGAAIFYAPELASGIVQDDAAIAILTDIYDGKSDFTSVLRNSPKFRIDRIVFSALWASNEDMVKGLFNAQANQGGLLARTCLVCPDEQRKPWPGWTSKEEAEGYEKTLKDLAAMLREILKVYLPTGVKDQAIEVSPSARFLFDRWYIPFCNKYRNTDRGGVAGRIHTTIKKLAIILAADELSLTVEARHMEKAIEECIALLPNYNTFLMGGGTNVDGQCGALIVKFLNMEYSKKLTRTELVDRLWMDYKGEVIDAMLTTLETAKVIEVAAGIGGSVSYKLCKRIIDKLEGKANGAATE